MKKPNKKIAFLLIILSVSASVTLKAAGKEVAVGTDIDPEEKKFIILNSKEVYEKLRAIFSSRNAVYKNQLNQGIADILNKIFMEYGNKPTIEILEKKFSKKMNELKSTVLAEQFIDFSKKLGFKGVDVLCVGELKKLFNMSNEDELMIDLLAQYPNPNQLPNQLNSPQDLCDLTSYLAYSLVGAVSRGIQTVSKQIDNFAKDTIAEIIKGALPLLNNDVDAKSIEILMESFGKKFGTEMMIEQIIDACVGTLVQNYNSMRNEQKILISEKLISLSLPVTDLEMKILGNSCSKEFQDALAHLLNPKNAPETPVFYEVKTAKPYTPAQNQPSNKSYESRIKALSHEIEEEFESLKESNVDSSKKYLNMAITSLESVISQLKDKLKL
jgi:hypothetical protein